MGERENIKNIILSFKKKGRLHNVGKLWYYLCKCLNHTLFEDACICNKDVEIQKQLSLGRKRNGIRMGYKRGVYLCVEHLIYYVKSEW